MEFIKIAFPNMDTRLIEFLIEKNALDKFIVNSIYGGIVLRHKKYRIYDVGCTFTWSGCPEGEEYWEKLNSEYNGSVA